MIAYHHFVNHTPERAGRVYSLWLQQDLFGQWTLVRVRGGRQREPVFHSQVVESREAGEKLVAQLVKVRLRHGYVESTKTSTGEGSDAELMPDQKDVVGADYTRARGAFPRRTPRIRPGTTQLVSS